MKKLLVLLLLAGCGQAPQDSRVAEYVDRFERDFKVHVGYITIRFNSTWPQKDVMAFCSGTTVVIMQSHWETSSELTRESLIYHELGHCVFDLDHDDAQYEDGCSKSIMSTYMDSGWCLTKYRDQLISNLRSKL